MIKKLVLLAAVILPMFASAQTLKIGLVDTNEIIGKMPETAAAQQTLNDAQKKYQDELQRIEQEYQRQVEELQTMKEDELPAIRERKIRQVQETEQKAQVFQQQAYQDIQKQHDELMTPVVQKVRKAIESVGQENGYTLIQDIGSSLYFSAPVEDITSIVKKKLGL